MRLFFCVLGCADNVCCRVGKGITQCKFESYGCEDEAEVNAICTSSIG